MKEAARSDHLLRHNADAHDNVAQVYDLKHAEIYNQIEQSRLGQTLDELLACVDVRSPKVLDFGAGTGNVTVKLLARGCNVTAADVSTRSLALLQKKVSGDVRLSTQLLQGPDIPLSDATFDVVTCYSVLHHVPDYLHAIREMARVLRPGGLLYIDHEANESAWTGDADLETYRELTRLTRPQHLMLLARTGELFTYGFFKTAFIKAFVDPRYEREGDLHVWPDDHIEWDKLASVLADAGLAVEKTCDYLLYQPRGGRELHARYGAVCSDTRYIFARKTRALGERRAQ